MKHEDTITFEQLLDTVNRGCQKPGCSHHHPHDPLYLHAQCHLEAPVAVSIQKRILRLECSVCGRPIALVRGLPSAIVSVQ